MTSIFLSHASEDRDQADEMVELLKNQGLDVWYSDEDIRATSDWEKSIRAGLEGCEWFIVMLTPSSVQSEWVRAEVHWAIENRNGRVVPVLLETCDSTELHLRLETIQQVDLVANRMAGLNELLDTWKVSAEDARERYRPLRSLGKGGMGEATLAFDERLQREVAIKRMLPALAKQQSFHKRFIQEARDSAHLSHPNIVPIHSIGDDADGPFLVLEYLEGGTLQDRLDVGHMELKESLAFLRQILDALSHAHNHGVIHRDIKPQNILLTQGGVPKISDFGLAWVVGQDDRFAGDLREGTPRYLAPELRNKSEPPNARTDLFALGMTFFQMLTGRAAGRINESTVPGSVVPFLTKLCNENPNLRFATAAEALSDCIEIQRSLDLTARSEKKTRVLLDETVEMAFEHCGARRYVDAEAALERVISQSPKHNGALAGLLVLNLAKGNMTRAEEIYSSLKTMSCADPTYLRLAQIMESLREPIHLMMTPKAMPFSYLRSELAKSRLTKELIPFSKQTVNLGDIGELLVNLATEQGRSSAIGFNSVGPEQHAIQFSLEDVEVSANYENILNKRMFRPPTLEGMHLELVLEGRPFAVFRLVRYLTNNLAVRFKRSLDDRLQDLHQRYSADEAEKYLAVWQRFDLDFTALVKERTPQNEPGDGM